MVVEETRVIPSSWPIWRIIRFYRDGRPRRTIKAGVTLTEAKEHCHDPRTQKAGEWFDGFDLMKQHQKKYHDWRY